MANEMAAPVAKESIEDCIVSAEFWVSKIGMYAQSMRNRANIYPIVSALLSTLTGLAVWTKVAASTDPLAVALVVVMALAAAAVTVIPQTIGYGACAGAAATLGPRYGRVLGKLKSARAALQRDPDGDRAQFFAHEAVEEFATIKEAKDALQPFPAKLQEEIDAIRARQVRRPTNIASPAPTR